MPAQSVVKLFAIQFMHLTQNSPFVSLYAKVGEDLCQEAIIRISDRQLLIASP